MKILMFNYITFLLLAILIVPIILITHGVTGAYESIYENRDLSYKRFNEVRKGYYK